MQSSRRIIIPFLNGIFAILTKIHGNVNSYLLCAPLMGMRFRFKRYFCWRRCRLPRMYVKIRLVASSLPPQYHLKFRNGISRFIVGRVSLNASHHSSCVRPLGPCNIFPSMSYAKRTSCAVAIYLLHCFQSIFRPAKARQMQRAILYLYPPPSLR